MSDNDNARRMIDSSKSPTSVLTETDPRLVEPLELPGAKLKEWRVLPASVKSRRTVNPIRAIVDPIAANIQSGEARGDGKDHISLAVRSVAMLLLV
jgi:hypothetical protein